jgi:hypothetical protein
MIDVVPCHKKSCTFASYYAYGYFNFILVFFIFNRYVAQYNDMPSPLSNAEKLAESTRREDDMRREKDRDEVFKAYHERDPRLNLPLQRKGNA